jgi:hypothetical protein
LVARIRIGDADHAPVVLDPGFMPSPTLRRAVRIIEENQDLLTTAWQRIHGA